MQQCWYQSISRIVFVCTAILLAGNRSGEEANCEIVKASISTGLLADAEALSSCANNAEPQSMSTLIALAVEHRQDTIAAALIRAVDGRLITPQLVHSVALYELPQVLNLILDRRPELLEVRDEYGRTPLTAAALGRAYMAASVLLERGAREEIGQSLVVAISDSREIAYLIMEHRRGWLANQDVAAEVLGVAIEYGDAALLQFLVELGVQPDLLDSDGYHVMLHAPQYRDERFGQDNWEFMARHGAREQKAICSVPEDTLDSIEKYAPRWYAKKVSELRPQCSMKN